MRIGFGGVDKSVCSFTSRLTGFLTTSLAGRISSGPVDAREVAVGYTVSGVLPTAIAGFDAISALPAVGDVVHESAVAALAFCDDNTGNRVTR